LQLYAGRVPGRVTAVDDDALAALKAYSWPGNVRQLENVIERAAIVCEGPILTIAELSPELLDRKGDFRGDGARVTPQPARWPAFQPAAPTNGAALSAIQGSMPPGERAERERREREQLVRALAASGGNKAEAARALGMARSTIVSRLKRLGLS
jgi:transcriptional regulator of acetoin/glycerol metabolism